MKLSIAQENHNVHLYQKIPKGTNINSKPTEKKNDTLKFFVLNIYRYKQTTAQQKKKDQEIILEKIDRALSDIKRNTRK